MDINDPSFKELNTQGIENVTDNEEILALWFDYLQSQKTDTINSVKNAHQHYVSVYNKTDNLDYLCRALSIVNK